jgi:hypothetical protein
MKVKDLLKNIKEYQKKYKDFLEFDIYTEQLREDDKELKRKSSKDGGQEWGTISDSEMWEYFECCGYNTIFKDKKIFTINVNY